MQRSDIILDKQSKPNNNTKNCTQQCINELNIITKFYDCDSGGWWWWSRWNASKLRKIKKNLTFCVTKFRCTFHRFPFFVVFLVKCQFFICFISIDCNTIFFQMIGALATLVNVLSEIEFWHLITIQNKRKKCCIVLWECLSICPFYVQWHSQILHNENDDKWMKCAAGPKMGKYSMNRSGEPAFK